MRTVLCLPFLVLFLFGFQSDDWDIPGYDCGDCHGSAGWDVLDLSGFNHQDTNFDLEGSHQFQACSACHSGETLEEKHQFERESSCVSCHLDIHQSVLGDECSQCHGLNSWQVTNQTFDHNLTQFSLLGSHAQLSCQDCHSDTDPTGYAQTPTDCYACHREEYDLTQAPDHLSAGIDTECLICHSVQTGGWQPSTFDHDIHTNYILSGAHRDAQCAQCHTGTFDGTADDCWACHQKDYVLAGTDVYPDAPVHTENVYSQDCAICHNSMVTWEGGELDHNLTDFPLTGLHETSECAQCHGDGLYELPVTCEECHSPNQIAETTYETSEFDHTTHNIITECEFCHITTGWDQHIFEHINFSTSTCDQCHLIEYQETTEPAHDLVGYISSDCESCHSTEEWDPSIFEHQLTSPCMACHTVDYENTTEPDHTLLGYPTSDCEFCHSVNEWDPIIFDHEVSTTCVTCHLLDYQNAVNPVHLSEEGYSENCQECHTDTETWLGASFDHSLTQFPLTGAHITSECAQCHGDGLYELPLTCEECHSPNQIAETTYETSEFDHTTHNIITECEFCHITTGWDQHIFEHINFSTSTCDQCHLIEYQETTEPDHTVLGYPASDCASCHSVEEWDPIIFDHEVSTTCVTCHLLDYQNAVNPVHLSEEGYSENCQECHTDTETWLGASFDHSLTQFPLTGAHITSECAQCHGDGLYELPLTCEECHSPNQIATTTYELSSYDHVTHNIIQTCENCHTTDDWLQTIFDHVDFTETACEQCHLPEHIASVDPPHDSGNIRSQCDLCHSNSNWVIDNFTHTAEQTDYVLNGLHVQVQCLSCHVNNIYQGTENTCQSSGCHFSDFQTASPDHQVYGYPIEHCTSCHAETGWSPDIYSHDLTFSCQDCHIPDYQNAVDPPHTESTGFSLTCDQCHSSVETWDGATYNHDGVTSGCFDCHSLDYYATTSPNHEQLGYSTVCNDCHTSFTDWSDAQIDHSFYPISDDHADVTCNECHSQPEFQPSCWECHETDFFEEHSTGESVMCWNCHTTLNWEDVTFDHTGITTGCIECHSDDHLDAHGPDFPTDCESCHNTEDWDETTFSHQFPIDPSHQDETNETCESCHTGGNTVEFTCFNSGCHSVSEETSEHCEDGPQDCESCNGMTYPYSGVTSMDCYSCHPNGDEDDCGGDDDRSGKAPKDDVIQSKPWKKKWF